MQWTDLPRGAFTGIDWCEEKATKGFDPYLVWAEADRFSGYGYPPEQLPTWLPLLIELAADVTIADLLAGASTEWMRVPSVYGSTAAPKGLRFCTARVAPAFYEKLRTSPQFAKLIRRHELGLPAGAHGSEHGCQHEPMEPTPVDPPPLLIGNVIGLIDGGLAFAHANFLRDGRDPRVRYFWRQDTRGVGKTPQAFGYGYELTGSDIRDAINAHTYGSLVDETAVYRHFAMGTELDKRLNHGTHVLDVACGPREVTSRIAGLPGDPLAPPSWVNANDKASECDIVAVQLDWPTVRDTSGGSMTVHIMDALLYILSRCAPDAKIVVNLSWGTLAGSHDGSSVLEAAMDQLIALESPRLRIVLPASNACQSRMHANAKLVPGQPVTLRWCGLPGDGTQNFLELWLPRDADGITVQITPPGHQPLPAVACGSSKMWAAPAGNPLCAVIFPETNAMGDDGTCALIAVAPTFSFDPAVATAPSGVWEVTVANHGKQVVPFDAYVERDDEIIGVRTGALQSHFEDGSYDTSGNPGSFIDAPASPTPIRRSGSFNSIATGKKIDSVGGTRVTGPRWARYSPQNPDPDGGWLPQRGGVVKAPTESAPSDENGILLGLGAAGSRSGSGGVVRLVGTSDAAPQVTRRIFNAL
jgi:hypothetical protein